MGIYLKSVNIDENIVCGIFIDVGENSDLFEIFTACIRLNNAVLNQFLDVII